MSKVLTTYQKRLVELARAGGTDAELALLKFISEMSDEMEALKQEFKDTIKEVKASVPDLNKVLMGFKGPKGDTVQGPPGPPGKKPLEGVDYFIPDPLPGVPGPRGLIGPKPQLGVDYFIPDPIPGPMGPAPVLGVDYFIPDPLPGSPDTPEEIRDKLATLVGDNRLDIEHIKGVKKFFESIVDGRQANYFGSSHGIDLLVDGTAKGFARYLNLIPGSGMTIDFMQVGERMDVMFTAAGGAALTIETPPEAPDADNTVFTVTAEPQWVVADGTTYFDGQGYTYAALQITFDVAPSTSVRAIL